MLFIDLVTLLYDMYLFSQNQKPSTILLLKHQRGSHSQGISLSLLHKNETCIS